MVYLLLLLSGTCMHRNNPVLCPAFFPEGVEAGVDYDFSRRCCNLKDLGRCFRSRYIGNAVLMINWHA